MLINKNNLHNLKRKEALFESKDYDVEIKLIAFTLENQLNLETEDNNKFFCNVIRLSCVDENNQYLFKDNQEVKQLPSDLARELFYKCLELNNLGNKSIENIAKN